MPLDGHSSEMKARVRDVVISKPIRNAREFLLQRAINLPSSTFPASAHETPVLASPAKVAAVSSQLF